MLRFLPIFACFVLMQAQAQAAGAMLIGTIASLQVDAHGTTLHLVAANRLRSVQLAANARVQERSVTGAWTDVPLVSLKAGEPVTVTLDSAGKATLVQANFTAVATQLVIVQNGYVVAANGNAYKLVGDAASAAIGLPLGIYLVLKIDPQTGEAFDLVASRVPLTAEGTPVRTVSVTFTVEVPVNTPGTDVIYMATDRTNWTANAIRMSPLPGNKWTATLTLTGGTVVAYKYTRGSWATDERDRAGSEIANRTLTITSSADTQAQNDTVARWADLPS